MKVQDCGGRRQCLDYPPAQGSVLHGKLGGCMHETEHRYTKYKTLVTFKNNIN